MENIRIKFSKTDNAKYISHLDLNRFFQRIFKMSGVPVWVTEGFNPHIYLHFLLPLSLGTESVCEFIDCKITNAMEYSEIKSRINALLPAGFSVISVDKQNGKAEEIAFCEYEMEFPEISAEEICGFLENEKIEVVKKTKRKEYTVDLKAEMQNICISKKGNGAFLKITLPSTENRNINPDLLITAMNNSLGKDVFCRIKRTAVLKENLTDFN